MRQICTYIFLFLEVLLFSFLSSTSHTFSPPAFAPNDTPAPGLQIYGYVRLGNQQGVPGVTIYRSFASYPGAVVATTDANGFYESGFTKIPGDEMIGVWAERPGFVFTPERYYWRHYFGYESRGLNFNAAGTSLVYLPIIANSPGVN